MTLKKIQNVGYVAGLKSDFDVAGTIIDLYMCTNIYNADSKTSFKTMQRAMDYVANNGGFSEIVENLPISNLRYIFPHHSTKNKKYLAVLDNKNRILHLKPEQYYIASGTNVYPNIGDYIVGNYVWYMNGSIPTLIFVN